MPYFVLPYDRVVEDTSGHIVRFVKDTATFVPPVQSLIDKVQMFGGREVDPNDVPPLTEAQTSQSLLPADKVEPATPVADAQQPAPKQRAPRPAARG